MIKLIASDMDGTLLDEHSQVPPETYDLILGLREHGVRFAVSSGRRYDTLCEFFAPVIDRWILSPPMVRKCMLMDGW